MWIDPWGLNKLGIKNCNSNGRKKPVNLPSKKKIIIKIEHILSGHSQGGDRTKGKNSKKTLFPENMSHKDIEKAVREAYSNVKVVETQGDRVLGRGTSGNMSIEMWINKQTKEIETAYPYNPNPYNPYQRKR